MSAPLPGSLPSERERAGGLSFRVVATGFALLLVLGVATGVYLHRRYVGFERIAARHVPGDASLVVRWDVEKVSLFEPTRRHLLPLLDRGGPAPELSERSTETRRRRVARDLDLDVGRDLREVVALVGPEPGDWAFVLAGSFPSSLGARDLAGLVAREGWSWQERDGGLFVSPEGAALGRARDGVFVIASNEARARAALPVGPIPAEIERTGAGSLVARSRRGLPNVVTKPLSALGEPERVTAVLAWGNPIEVTVSLHYPSRVPDGAVETARALAGRFWAPRAAPELRVLPSPPGSSRELRLGLGLDEQAVRALASFVARKLDPSLPSAAESR